MNRKTDSLRRDDGTNYTLRKNGGVWITVRNISVNVRDTGEGVSVALYPLHHENDGDSSIGETWATFNEGAENEVTKT